MLWDMNITRHARLAASVTGLALLLSACGGGGGGTKDNGVASLADSSAASASESAAGDTKTSEEQTLAWVQCMREQGLDIADPTVDSDGNLVLGRPRGGNAGGGTTGSSGAQPFDRDAFSKATEKCGSPPQTGGGFSQEDRQAMQDSLLKMAQCLRDEGLDVADPDFSSQGPGGAPPSNSSSGAASQPRGPFGNIDMNDAKVQAAFTSCQARLGTTFPGGRGARAGGGGNG